MQCAYCLSEMPDGAAVCAHCARRQPRTPAQRRSLAVMIAAGAFVLLVGGGVAWRVVVDQERQAAVDRIVECAHLHGNKSVDAAFVDSEIDIGIQETGKSWRAGAEYAALSMEKSGLLPLGACFVTQETLFSD